MLPKEAIIEFKELFKKVYGIEISDEEASFRANNLVNLYAAVYDEPPVGQLHRNNKEPTNLHSYHDKQSEPNN